MNDIYPVFPEHSIEGKELPSEENQKLKEIGPPLGETMQFHSPYRCAVFKKSPIEKLGIIHWNDRDHLNAVPFQLSGNGANPGLWAAVAPFHRHVSDPYFSFLQHGNDSNGVA